MVPDDRVARINESLTKAAWTGVPGDGVIAVPPVEEFSKIREGRKVKGGSDE